MRNHISSLFIFLLCLCTFTKAYAGNGVSPDEAVRIAKQLTADSGQAYRYYISKTTLKDTIAYGNDLRGEYWMVFVDEMPGANWQHPCKYIFINAAESEPLNYVVDAVMPPYDIEMTEYNKAAKVSKINDDGLNHPLIPKRFTVRSQNSPHTYALIISGGSNPKSNESKYWNDCAFIYNTLIKAYGVPKRNIKVLMSDGADPSEDLNIGDFSDPEYISSPLDLDGDGYPEIDYPATAECLKSAVDDFANKLTDDDHLFVFVTDHGGGGNGKESTLCLWDNIRIYADEFNDYFKNVNAGYISFVLGQCYSGGFTKYLRAANRIVVTACKDTEQSYGSEEIPYDEFLCHWTSYMNGYDPYGNKIKTTNMPTILEAFNYSVANDVYANGMAFRSETPTISILENSTAEELTLANVPPVVDICFDNSMTDKYDEDSNLNITLLNSNEERVTAENFDPVTNTPQQAKIEMRLYNRGVKEYKGSDASISVFGHKASLVASTDRLSQDTDNVMGMTDPLTGSIMPGSYITMEFLCNLKDRSQYPVGRTNYIAFINDNVNTGNWDMATTERYSKNVYRFYLQ